MFIIVAALVVIIAVVVLGGGAALLGGDERPRREGLFGGTGPVLVIIAVVGVVVVLFIGPALVFGLRGGGDDDVSAPVPSVLEEEATTTTTSTTARPVTPTSVPDTHGRRDVRVFVRSEADFPEVTRAVDELEDGEVLHVTASGFFPINPGGVAQCRGTLCVNGFPVQFDGGGRARFQYQVFDQVSGTECGPDAGCALVVTNGDGQRAELPIVFAESAREPARVTVTPLVGLEDGQSVTVSLSGFRPGARLAVVQCAPPATPARKHCGRPGPVAPVTIGGDGRASARFTVSSGSVGGAGRQCGRRDVCGIAVLDGDVLVNAPVVRVAFSAGPTASYDPIRVAAGLAAAILLAALATWLVRATDWGELTEAATPEMDAADLTAD